MTNKEFLKKLERELEINGLEISLKRTLNQDMSELLTQRSNIKDMIIAVLKNELVIKENRKVG